MSTLIVSSFVCRAALALAAVLAVANIGYAIGVDAPAVLWEVSGSVIVRHALVNQVVCGPQDSGPGENFSITPLNYTEYSQSGMGFMGWTRAQGQLSGRALYGELELRGMAMGELLTNSPNTFKGADVLSGGISVYFRGPGNGVRPSFDLTERAAYHLTARSDQSFIGAQAYIGGVVVSGDGSGTQIEQSVVISNDIVNSSNCTGPFMFAQFPGTEYWKCTSLMALALGCEAALGAWYPVGHAGAASKGHLTVDAHLHEGVAPISKILYPSNGQAILPVQVATTHFIGFADDPDDAGAAFSGIAYCEWRFEQYDGSWDVVPGRDVNYSWPTERKDASGEDIPYSVVFWCVDNEGMYTTSAIKVVVRGPVPEVWSTTQVSPNWLEPRLGFRYNVRSSTGADSDLDLVRAAEHLWYTPAPGQPWNQSPSNKWVESIWDKGGWAEPFDSGSSGLYFEDYHGTWTQGGTNEFDCSAHGGAFSARMMQEYLYKAPWFDPRVQADNLRWPRIPGTGVYSITHDVVPGSPGVVDLLRPAPWLVRISKAGGQATFPTCLLP